MVPGQQHPGPTGPLTPGFRIMGAVQQAGLSITGARRDGTGDAGSEASVQPSSRQVPARRLSAGGPPARRVLGRRVSCPQCRGTANDRVHEAPCGGQFAAGGNPRGDFEGSSSSMTRLVHPFVMPRDQQQPRARGRVLRRGVVGQSALRRQQHAGGTRIERFDREHRVEERLAGHDHAGPSAEGRSSVFWCLSCVKSRGCGRATRRDRRDEPDAGMLWLNGPNRAALLRPRRRLRTSPGTSWGRRCVACRDGRCDRSKQACPKKNADRGPGGVPSTCDGQVRRGRPDPPPSFLPSSFRRRRRALFASVFFLASTSPGTDLLPRLGVDQVPTLANMSITVSDG